MRKLWCLLLILGLLQLAVSLFTYGFSLYDDEATWHYIGRNWLRWGLVPYKGGFDNKSPLIFLIYGISDLLFGVNYWFPRILGTVVQTVGIWYLYKIALHMAGRRAAILAVSMYGLALLWRSTEGRYVSLTETYEVTCITIAIYFFLKGKEDRNYFLSGLAAALGLAFRLTGIVGIGAIAFFSFRRRGMAWFAAGILVCLGALLGAAVLAGIRPGDLWHHAFLDNLRGSGSNPAHITLYLERLTKGFFHSELVLFYPPTLVYFLMKRKIDILFFWLAGGCFCILVFGVFSEAHFKDILPPLALASAVCIEGFRERLNLSFRKTLAVIWVCFFPKDVEPLLSAAALLHPAAGTGTPQSYCNPPYPPLTNYARKQLGLWIRSTTRPGDMVYIAGFGPPILVYTERRCPSIYFSTNEWEGARKVFYQEMSGNKPDLLAIPLNASYDVNVSEEQRNFIGGMAVSPFYRADTCLYGYMIYRKNTK